MFRDPENVQEVERDRGPQRMRRTPGDSRRMVEDTARDSRNIMEVQERLEARM